MITFKELLQDNQISDIPTNHQHNLEELLIAINIIRKAYGKPMTISSCYRSLQKHKDIYRAKGIINPPMGSQHLYGEAVDIYDPKQELQSWVLSNLDMLEVAGLYCEDFSATPNWVHFQLRQFKSYKPGGTRFFKP